MGVVSMQLACRDRSKEVGDITNEPLKNITTRTGEDELPEYFRVML
jgi:hypothetical protein